MMSRDAYLTHTKQDLFALIKAAKPFTFADAEREQVTVEANENDELPVTCSGEEEQEAATNNAFPGAA